MSLYGSRSPAPNWPFSNEHTPHGAGFEAAGRRCREIRAPSLRMALTARAGSALTDTRLHEKLRLSFVRFEIVFFGRPAAPAA